MAAPLPIFDAAALTTFWEDAGAMSLSAHTRTQLVVKGIELPGDLEEYDDEGLKKIFSNLAKPPKEMQAGGRCLLLVR